MKTSLSVASALYLVVLNSFGTVVLNQPSYSKTGILPAHALGFRTPFAVPYPVTLYDVDGDGLEDIAHFAGTGIMYGTSATSSSLLPFGPGGLVQYTEMVKSNESRASHVTSVDGSEVMVTLVWQFLTSGLHSGSCVLHNMTNRPTRVIIDPPPASNALTFVGQFGGALYDVDNDGYHDYVTEGAYVFYGPLATNVVWLDADGVDGTNGVYIGGMGPPFGRLGDLNGDGLSDLLCGSRILLGRTNRFPFARSTAEQVFDGTNGWALGISGYQWGALDDFNGDELADIWLDTRIIFGSRTSLHGLSQLDGTNGIEFSLSVDHLVPQEHFGNSVAAVGDVNADGYSDFAVACKLWNDKWYNYPQNCYVIYGRPIWPQRDIVVSNGWFDAVRGFIVQDPSSTGTPHEYWGPSSNIGNPLGGKGDFNGDGYDDPLIGCDGANELYVFFGGESPSWPPALIWPERVSDSTTGLWEYVLETNTSVIGMKATNAALYAWVNGMRAPEYDAGFGTRYFTNEVTWASNATITIQYACSNMLGISRSRTTLTISPVPEPALTLLLFCCVGMGALCRSRDA